MTGVLGSLHGGTGIAQAGQNAMNTVWAVPPPPNPLLSLLGSLLLFVTLGQRAGGHHGAVGLVTSACSFGQELHVPGRVLALKVNVVQARRL